MGRAQPRAQCLLPSLNPNPCLTTLPELRSSLWGGVESGKGIHQEDINYGVIHLTCNKAPGVLNNTPVDITCTHNLKISPSLGFKFIHYEVS